MTSWGDYAITHVREDENGTIVKVKRWEVGEDKIRNKETKTRKQIISSIEVGNDHTTALKNSNGRWDLGEEVHVLEINGSKYIRTDNNEIEEDNLEDLPAF